MGEVDTERDREVCKERKRREERREKETGRRKERKRERIVKGHGRKCSEKRIKHNNTKKEANKT